MFRGAYILPLILCLILIQGTAAAKSEKWHVATLLGGLFTTTGHGAVRLQDGRVLVIWGSEIRLYDPVGDRSTATGGMHVKRVMYDATLLRDGRVLVVGGSEPGRYGDMLDTGLQSAELYDPANASWKETGPLNESRAELTATALSDGRALVIGGYGGSEVYDPEQDRWTASRSPRDSSGHTATLLSDGRVLIAGGLMIDKTITDYYGGPPTVTTSTADLVAVKAPENQPSSLPPKGQGYAAVADLLYEKLYDESDYRYDSTAITWRPTGALNQARSHHTATLLADGRVLVTGGWGPSGARPKERALSTAEIYDPSTGKWRTTGSLRVARAMHSAVLLSTGKVVVLGGMNRRNIVATAEVFDPQTGRWHKGRPLRMPDGAMVTAIPLSNGKVLIVGETNTPELYTP